MNRLVAIVVFSCLFAWAAQPASAEDQPALSIKTGLSELNVFTAPGLSFLGKSAEGLATAIQFGRDFFVTDNQQENMLRQCEQAVLRVDPIANEDWQNSFYEIGKRLKQSWVATVPGQETVKVVLLPNGAIDQISFCHFFRGVDHRDETVADVDGMSAREAFERQIREALGTLEKIPIQLPNPAKVAFSATFGADAKCVLRHPDAVEFWPEHALHTMAEGLGKAGYTLAAKRIYVLLVALANSEDDSAHSVTRDQLMGEVGALGAAGSVKISEEKQVEVWRRIDAFLTDHDLCKLNDYVGNLLQSANSKAN